LLQTSPQWVHVPVASWLDGTLPGAAGGSFRFVVVGADRASSRVERLV
jgi:hypothetical protein